MNIDGTETPYLYVVYPTKHQGIFGVFTTEKKAKVAKEKLLRNDGISTKIIPAKVNRLIF